MAITNRIMPVIFPVLIASIFAPVFSQIPYLMWTKPCSTGINNPWLTCVAGLGDNGYAIGGREYKYTAYSETDCDLWVTRVDTAGNVLWSKTFPDTSNRYEYGRSLIFDRHGHIVITGSKGPNGYYLAYIRIVHMDILGNVLRDTTYPNLEGDPTQIVESRDGGYYFAAVPIVNSNMPPYVAKLDSSGKLLWRNSIDSTFVLPWGVHLNVQQDNSVVAAAVFHNGSSEDVATCKFGPDGSRIRWKPLSDPLIKPSQNEIKSMIEAANGDLLVSAKYLDVTPFSECIYRIDTAGNLVWRRTLPRLYPFVFETPGKVIITGSAEINGSGGTNFVFCFVDSGGNIIGEHRTPDIFVPQGDIVKRGNSYFGASIKSYCLFRLDYPPFFIRGFHPGTREMFEDSIVTDTVVAGDSTPTDSIRFFVSGLPNQITSTGRTCIIRYMPYMDSDSGLHRISIRIKDKSDQSDSMFQFIHVKAVNDPPELKSAGFTVSPGAIIDTVKVVSILTDEENDPIIPLWRSSHGDSLSTTASFSFLKAKVDSIDTLSVLLADSRGAFSNRSVILNYKNNSAKVPVRRDRISKRIQSMSLSLRFKNSLLQFSIPGSIGLSGSMRIFDIQGHLVRELKISGETASSVHADLRMLSIGIYFLDVLMGDQRQVTRMIVR
jgi:hypothetical protein